MNLKPNDNEAEKTWLKIENNIKTIAVGDGTSDGRDCNFQEYFNKGYAQGFTNGYAAGYYKGSTSSENMFKDKKIEEHELIKKPKTGWCQICINKGLENQTIQQISTEQMEIRKKNLHILHAKYSSEICLVLPNTL